MDGLTCALPALGYSPRRFQNSNENIPVTNKPIKRKEKPEDVPPPHAKRRTATVNTTKASEETVGETWEELVAQGLTVEALLALKMTGKSKFDYKGRSEQQMAYIKKLRLCVTHYVALDDQLTQEKEQSRVSLEEERRERQAEVSAMQRKHDALETQWAVLNQGMYRTFHPLCYLLRIWRRPSGT